MLLNSHLSFLLLALLASSTTSSAQDLTIPPQGYSSSVHSQDLLQRTNDQFPLSDQSNVGMWQLNHKFSDEFEAEELNSTRWHSHNPQWLGRPPTQFHTKNVSLEDGELVFRINQHGNAPLDSGYTHSAGFIKSKGRILYGYFEMEAKLIYKHRRSNAQL